MRHGRRQNVLVGRLAARALAPDVPPECLSFVPLCIFQLVFGLPAFLQHFADGVTPVCFPPLLC